MTEYEDLQETQAVEIYVKRILDQEIFVKGLFEFSCANGTLKRPDRPRLSSVVEGNLRQEDDDGIEVSDKKEVTPKTRGLWVEISSTSIESLRTR